MAIIKELYRTRSDGVNLYHIYSDGGRQLLQVETGIVYDEAIDVEGAPYTYEETGEAKELTAEEALAIILGGEIDAQK